MVSTSLHGQMHKKCSSLILRRQAMPNELPGRSPPTGENSKPMTVLYGTGKAYPVSL
jgi:hypothetical protein